MKRLSGLLLALLAAGAAQRASAFDYSDNDLLLVFRADGFNDVEFDLGSVSNYLGLASGAQVTVTNFDLGLVNSNFGGDLSTVNFALLAATANTNPLPRVWLGDASSSGTPTALTYSRWSQLHSTVSFLGTQPTIFTATNASASYVVSASDPSSFSFIASSGGQLNGRTLGGAAPFSVESTIPGTLAFYELQISTVTPKPPAPLWGRFSLDASGHLVFTAGAAVTLTPARIVGIVSAGGQWQVSFTTGAGGNYRLRSAASLNGPWTTLPASVAGDGTVKTLNDTPSGAARFYSIVTSSN